MNICNLTLYRYVAGNSQVHLITPPKTNINSMIHQVECSPKSIYTSTPINNSKILSPFKGICYFKNISHDYNIYIRR